MRAAPLRTRCATTPIGPIFRRSSTALRSPVLGRLGHEANPNAKARPRLILSASAAGLERRPDGWWWNPCRVPWGEVVAAVLPAGGRVAVPGGRRVFDLFLALGYDAFHLTRAEGVRVGEGVALFSDCDGASPRRRCCPATGFPGRAAGDRSRRAGEPDGLASPALRLRVPRPKAVRRCKRSLARTPASRDARQNTLRPRAVRRCKRSLAPLRHRGMPGRTP